MTNRAAIVQLARLLGKQEFYLRLSLAEGAEPPDLDAERFVALRSPEALGFWRRLRLAGWLRMLRR